MLLTPIEQRLHGFPLSEVSHEEQITLIWKGDDHRVHFATEGTGDNAGFIHELLGSGLAKEPMKTPSFFRENKIQKQIIPQRAGVG